MINIENTFRIRYNNRENLTVIGIWHRRRLPLRGYYTFAGARTRKDNTMEEKNFFQAEFTPDRTVVKESYRVTMMRSASGIINIVLAILCLGFAVYLILPDPRYMLKYHPWYIAYFLFVAGFFIVRFLLDDNIRNEDYLTQTYPDIPLLSVIPDMHASRQ